MGGKKADDSEIVSLTDKADDGASYGKALRAHRRRTGLRPAVLLADRDDIPNGLTPNLVTQWLDGRTKTARKVHLDYVLRLWAEIPAAVDVTEDLVAELRLARTRSGVSVPALFRRPDIPEDLTAAMVNSYFRRQSGTIRADHLAFLRAAWRDSGEGAGERIAITEQMLAELHAQERRTGMGPTMILRDRADAPRDLTPAMIGRWTRSQNATAGRHHWEYVLRCYEATPDRRPLQRTAHETAAPKKGYEPIPPQALSEIRAHRERTGLSPAKLLRGRKDVPPYLNDTIVFAWMRGRTPNAMPGHVDYILDIYAASPDKP